MIEAYFSIFGLYFFALWGFILKKIFKDEFDSKTLTKVAIYFFQPILWFWGFTNAPIQLEILWAWIHHLLTLIIVLGILFFTTKFFIKDNKKRILSFFTWTNGNTWNIWIPLATVLFGPVWVVTATMINFFNILWNIIVGVYFYSRWEYSISKSIKNIFTMPLLRWWILGIILNISWFEITWIFQKVALMGANTSIFISIVFTLSIFSLNKNKKNWF